MNRRIRNRTSGGVGGRRGATPASYPILKDPIKSIQEKSRKPASQKRKLARCFFESLSSEAVPVEGLILAPLVNKDLQQ